MTVHTLPLADRVDVLIIGAGLSGIGMARYLQRAHPHKRFQILESRARLGGTWDLFRYPGIRSDSDLYTFGFEFKPWTHDKAIADAGSILSYLRDSAAETGVEQHIRCGQQVVSADWRSDLAQWSVQVEDLASGQRRTLSCTWLFSAAGYYRYDEGFSPRFEGMDRYQGRVVHPQRWPEGLDYSGQRVVVIGSGATAITLIPAMVERASQVTMLQRTPSYVMALPAKDPIALMLRKLLPERLAYRLTRYKNVSLSRGIWRFCQRYPKLSRRLLRVFTQRALPAGYPVDRHFNPPYNPWEQRLCAAPDGDFFKALSSGRASVVTDHIESFTERGLRLKSGIELEADLIVTATGLNLQMFGGVRLSIDGKPVAMDQTVTYKGMMLSGVPNFAFAIGYTNSSWRLKVGLICEHFCRLLEHMDRNAYASARAEAPPGLATRPLLDFGAGYVQRELSTLPRQGASKPWITSMDYFDDVKTLRKGPVTDPHLQFQAVPPAAPRTAEIVRMAGVRA